MLTLVSTPIRSIAVPLTAGLVALALLIGSPSARADELVIEGRDFSRLRLSGGLFVVEPLPDGASAVAQVILPIADKVLLGTLSFRITSPGSGRLVPGIYLDTGCSSASAARPNLCAAGTFQIFAVRYDASGQLTRLLFSFAAFEQTPFGEVAGLVDYRRDAAEDDAASAPPAQLAGSLEVDFTTLLELPEGFDPIAIGPLLGLGDLRRDGRGPAQVFDPRAPSAAPPEQERGEPVAIANVDQPEEDRSEPLAPARLERTPARAGSAPVAEPPAPARLELAPAPAAPQPPLPARSFLFRGAALCCAAGLAGTPVRDSAPRSAPLPAPSVAASPDLPREIVVIERAEPAALPTASVWTRLDGDAPLAEPAKRGASPGAAPARTSGAAPVASPSAVAWLRALLSGLLEPLAELWTAWRA